MRGFWDTVGGFIEDLGITGDSAIATARAFASPTMANIRAVEAAFGLQGTSAPPELMNQLYARYYDSIRSNPLAQSGAIQSTLSNILPWLIGGGILFFIIKGKGK